MRTLIVLIAVATLAACSQPQTQQAGTTTQSVPIQGITTAAHGSSVHVQQFRVTPQNLQKGGSATATVRLDSADPDTLVRLNWFDPSGWSVFEQTAPANSTAIDFTAPPQLFREEGTYRAELRTGRVVQGEATVDVSS
ncbi:MAG TPA: hypothetical protein VL284_09465 [Thermoanaerobaculia bacterium]|nr:hypothetical protein [Thermoanaerobaculia bacterium]